MNKKKIIAVVGVIILLAIVGVYFFVSSLVRGLVTQSAQRPAIRVQAGYKNPFRSELQHLGSIRKPTFAVAKEDLGCDSLSSCHGFCEQETNFQKCAEFAKQEGFSDEAAAFEIMKPAMKQFLGCDSMESCMAFCMNPLNMPKCMEFAKNMGFDTGGIDTKGASSQEWCSNSSSECSWDASQNVCMCNGPQTCSQIKDCSWNGSYCSCGSFSQTSEEPPEVWCAKVAREGETCSWDGTSCSCWNPGECTKWQGCTWTGSRCDCASASFTSESSSTGSAQPSSSEPPEVWCPKLSQGDQVCTWDGSSCTCTTATQYQTPQYGTPLDYQTPELKGEPIPSSEQTSPSASSVQGVFTEDFLQLIRSFLNL